MTEATYQIARGDIWEGEVTVSAQERVDTRLEIAARRSRRSAAGMNGLSSLAEVIEKEIAPRLARRQRAGNPAFCRIDAPVETDVLFANDSVMALADLVLGSDVAAARNYVECKHSEGASLESLYIDLLGPVARHLGDRWADDRCDFTEVTLGLGHLQQLLRELSPMFQSEFRQIQPSDRILLVAAPGDQHTFGLSMVAEFFRRSGWDVWGGPLKGAADLYAIVRADWFDVVGLSLGHDTPLPVLANVVRTLRRSSRNRMIGVIVGGPLVIQHPELVLKIGADGSAADGRDAPARAREVVSKLRQGA